jgi:hypothetical protein
MNKINFVFLRHGESCQQVAYNQLSGSKLYSKFYDKFYDPTLSDSGKIDSINSGIYMKKFLENQNLKIKDFDIIGSSPMIRAIETAYYMTNENYNNSDIFVFPYLRECYHCDSRDNVKLLDNHWPLKSIKDQQTYFNDIGINNINFKYVKDNENTLRLEPGDIQKFIEWFSKIVELPDKPIINVLVLLHSHVIRELTGRNVNNNGGFIMTSKYNKKSKKIIYNKDNIILVISKIRRSIFECPTVRCPGIC